MNRMVQSVLELRPLLMVAVVALTPLHVQAATFTWTGNFGSSFDLPLNWALVEGGPAAPPPGVGDTAIYALADVYDVRFPGDRTNNALVVTGGTPTFEPSGGSDATYVISGLADIAGGELNIDDGMVTSAGADMILQAGSVRVRSNGEINVRNGSRVFADQLLLGSANTGRILVDGRDTLLQAGDVVQNSFLGVAGGNGILIVQDSAQGNLFGTALSIGADNVDGSTGRLQAQLGGTITTDSLLVGSAGLQDQEGELRVVGTDQFDIPASIEMRDGAALTLGAGQRSSGSLLISGGANFTTGTGLTTVNSTGAVDVLLGTFHVRGDLLVNGGLIEVADDQSQVTLAEAGRVDIHNGARLSSGAAIDFPENSLTQISGRDATLELRDATSRLRPGSRMEVLDTGRLELRSADLIIGTGAELHVDGGGLFISTSSAGDMSRIDVDGGTLEHSMGEFVTDASPDTSITLMVQNAGHFELNNQKLPSFRRIDVTGSRSDFNAIKSAMVLGDDSVVEITDLATAGVGHLRIGGGLVANNSSIAAVPSLRVTGGATLHANGTDEPSIIGTHRPATPMLGDAARVTVESEGVVHFADLTVGHLAPTETDGHGELVVRTGGQVRADNIDIAALSSEATGLIEVANAGSLVMQSAGSALRIGVAGSGNCCAAQLRIVDEATFQAGSLPVEVRGTGTIDLLLGTLVAPGGVQLNAGRLFARGTVEGNLTNSGLVTQPFLPEGTPDTGMAGLVIQGDFVQQAAGITKLAMVPSIDASTAINDKIQIHGIAELDGTLQVDIIDIGGAGINFSVGDTFDLLTASDGISGEFATALLPSLENDLALRLAYTPNVVQLRVVAQGVPGDYNEDGVVNAADFVVWRNHEGTPFDLPNRDPNNNGNIGLADYQFWTANFGNFTGSGALQSAQVPEPASMSIWLSGLFAIACGWRGYRALFRG